MGLIPPEEIPEVPLCSPGQESIIAALYPTEDENIYYVLSDKLDGTHIFTSDKAEYEACVEAYNAAKASRDESLRKKQTETETEAEAEGQADQETADAKSSDEE